MSTAGTAHSIFRVPKFVIELGSMLHFAGHAIRLAATPPYNYWGEFTSELRFILRIATIPLLLTAFALSFGPAGIQATNVLGLFGASDRLGGLYVVLLVREFAPIVSGLVLAGVAGTAVCADLGAREIREETAALSVLGIDPIKALVVPRMLALLFASQIFNVFALLAGLVGAIAVVIQNNGDLGPFFSTFFGGTNTLELLMSFVKTGLFGLVIALVCCYKGQKATGGAEGVGRAVNQAVVIAFLAIGVVDYSFTQYILATNPDLSGLLK